MFPHPGPPSSPVCLPDSQGGHGHPPREAYGDPTLTPAATNPTSTTSPRPATSATTPPGRGRPYNAIGDSAYSNTASATTSRPALEELERRLVLSVPTPDHVVVVMEENHSYNEIIGSPSAPYINGLAAQGALMTNSFAVEHPSEPNYLDLFSGSNQGITQDGVDNPGSLAAPNLGQELLAKNLTWGAYVAAIPPPSFRIGHTHAARPRSLADYERNGVFPFFPDFVQSLRSGMKFVR